jgi:tetratricopeptide (TPR) repeat protein
MEVYAHWLQRAFPDRGLRQDYFKKWIADKPISHANLRLAHLLSEKKLATLVVTPNFDTFLSRALNLFGQEHIVCDHPATTERINPESADVQIVHVHGTYWFYDLCNLPSEIRDRSVDTRLQSVTMPSLLDDILRRHSAIVIGYSGWEGDVITNALKRRHTSTVPHNLYWFCYSRGDADGVPQCVRDSLDSCIVVPPARVTSRAGASPVMDPKAAAVSGELDPNLPAQLVLDKLVEAFTVKAPYLTQDPIGFFVGELTKSFPQELGEKTTDDIYDLRGVIQTVQGIRRSSKKKKPAALDSEMERVRDAVRRSAYPEAIKRVARLEPKAPSAGQKEMLMESALSASDGLGDNLSAQLRGYDLAVRLAKGKVLDRPSGRGMLARALFGKGAALGRLGRPVEEIAAYESLINRFGDSPERVPREQVAQALHNKGLALFNLNRQQDALASYEIVLKRFGDATDPLLREAVARSYVNKGYVLGEIGKPEEEISTYDEVLKRFGDATEPELIVQVAMALLNKGYTLGQLQRSEEAVPVFDEVVKRFGDASEPALIEYAMRALVNKGANLSALGRNDEAIATYDQAVTRFGAATETALREGVARALLNKAEVLKQLNRAEEARIAFREVLRRLEGVSGQPLAPYVGHAQRGLESLSGSAPPTV